MVVMSVHGVWRGLVEGFMLFFCCCGERERERERERELNDEVWLRKTGVVLKDLNELVSDVEHDVIGLQGVDFHPLERRSYLVPSAYQ